MPEQFDLTPLDLGIIAAYVLAIIGIGVWVGRKKEDTEGYLLAGRGQVWPLIGFALISANFSGTQYLALAGAGYENGISVWNYEWMAALVLVMFAVIVLPFYLRSKVDTMPEFLERRYDRRSRYAFSGFTIGTGMFIDAAADLYLGALVLQAFFPDAPLMTLVAVVAVLGGGYVILGGLQAVMITDTFQGVLLFIVGGLIFTVAFADIGFDWSELRGLAPEDGFTVAPPASDDFMPWPGIFTGVFWLGVYYWLTNHVVVQKVLSAKDENHGRWGVLFAGLMQLPLLVLLVFPGILARGVWDDLDDPDMAWVGMVFEYLPIGIRGIAIAALIAALMSTLDSILNGTASLIVNDFIKTRDLGWSEKRYLGVARIIVGGLMIFAALWAPVISQFDTIVEYFQSFLGYVTMPVVVILLGGLFWPRGSSDGAFWTLVIAGPIGLVAFLTGELAGWFDLQFLYGTGLMVLLSAGLFVAISVRTAAPATEVVDELTWNRGTWRAESDTLEGTPWFLNYRYMAAGLGLLTVAVVIPLI